jgi:hypothetical protein
VNGRRVTARPRAGAQVPRRRRRVVAAGIIGGWVLLLVLTRSLLAGTALLLLLVALGAGCLAGLRALGADTRHPWADAGSTDDYRDQASARQTRYGGPGAAWPEPGAAWPGSADDPGHDGFQYGDDGYLVGPDGYAGAHRVHAGVHDGRTGSEAALAATVAVGAPTVAEPHRPPIPLLRLVTGDSVAQTRTSGARAGRGPVDLVLPEVPTVSREHARFTFADGQWWVVNLGRNGLMLNGVPLSGAHALRDGDSIQWGRTPDAPMSRVEIS